MYFWILAVYVIVEFSFLISGVPEELRQSICKSYENQRYNEMYNEIFKVRDRVIADKEVNPCLYYLKHITELRSVKLETVDVEIDVITGDFGGDNGYHLIVDETVTIDIPAIIKCVIKLNDPYDILQYVRNEFEYYMVMHGTADNFIFEKVLMANITSNKNKSSFVLEESAVIAELLRNYKIDNCEFKSHITTWFKRKQDKPNKLKEICETLSSFGKLRKESPLEKPAESSHGKQKKSTLRKPNESSSAAKWKVINGTIEMGSKFLRVTDDTELKLSGIIVCQISVILDGKWTIRNEYFTMGKYEKKDEDKKFVCIFGPIKKGNKQIFVLDSVFLEKNKN